MVVILFPAGAFGSTIEYALRNFSNELASIEGKVLDNGSMHSYHKEFHPTTINKWDQVDQWQIATPVYPGLDYLSPVNTVQQIKNKISAEQKLILIHFDTVDQVYRNHLFAYYKTYKFLEYTLKDKPSQWNPKYTSVSDMQPYEIREALSYNLDEAHDYLQVVKQKQHNWLCVTPDDILYNFKNTVITMLDYCGLTLDPHCGLDSFYTKWFEKQQYIVKEFETIQMILKSLQGRPYHWSSLSIMGEAIVQHALRTQGIEIACYNLNQFPTTTQELKNTLINNKESNEH
jgi:hypothetical protein